MGEHELNKKLAEQAGFTPIYGGLYYENAPDFTQSLDACFKRLVPKALAAIISNPIWGLTRESGKGIDEATEILFREWMRQMAYPEKNDFALALCLAIEKLIDSKDM